MVTEIVCFVTVIVLLHLRLGLHCQFLGTSFLSVSGSFFFFSAVALSFSPLFVVTFVFYSVMFCGVLVVALFMEYR